MKSEQRTQLEQSLRHLDAELRRLVADDELKRLLTIIHKPGWTTVAEATLVEGIVAAMSAKVQTLHQLKATLMRGADLITSVP